MPQRLQIGSGYNGGAYRGNLIGGAEGAGFFDTLANVVQHVIPLVPGVIDAVGKIRGGKGEFAAYRAALKRDKDILNDYGSTVETAINEIIGLEKSDIITKTDGAKIKNAIYTAQERNLTALGNDTLQPGLASLKQWETRFNELFRTLSNAPPADRAQALAALLTYVAPGEAVAVARNANSLKDFQTVVHEKIVAAYNALQTVAAKRQFLYNLINIGATYLKKDGKASKAIKLVEGTKAEYPGWQGLATVAEEGNLFIPSGRTLYKAKYGDKNKDITVYQGPDGKYYSATTGKELGAKYSASVKDPTNPRRLPAGLVDPTGINLGNSRDWGPIAPAAAAADDDDDDAAQQLGNGWGRY